MIFVIFMDNNAFLTKLFPSKSKLTLNHLKRLRK